MTNPTRTIGAPSRLPLSPSIPPASNFPQALIDDTFRMALESSFAERGQALKGLFGADPLLRLLPKLFREADFQVSAGFSGGRFPVPNSVFELALADGASLCFDLRSQGGKLSAPHPVALTGFGATAWKLWQPFDKIVTDSAGLAGLSSPCFEDALKDITPEIMASPLGGLFPDKKVRPVALELLASLLENISRATPTPTAGSAPDLLSHLERIAFSALIYQNAAEHPAGFSGWDGALCHPAAASLSLLLNVPRFKENMARGKFADFDFSGIEALSLHWPDFPVETLLEGSELQKLGGRFTLDAERDSAETVHVDLKFHETKILWERAFGKSPIELNGTLRIVLKPGGRIEFLPEQLTLKFPVLPSIERPIFSLEAKLEGEVLTERTPEGALRVVSSQLSVRDLDLQTRESQALPLNAGEVSGNIQGSTDLKYDPLRPEKAIHADLALGGALQIRPRDQKRISQIDLNDLHWLGTVSFAESGGRYFPNLEDMNFQLGLDAVVQQGATPLLEAQGLYIDFSGGERVVQAGKIRQSADVSVDAAGIDAGQFAWKPRIWLELTSELQGVDFRLAGKGEWDLDSTTPRQTLAGDAIIIPPYTDLGSPFYFSVDGEDVRWGLEIMRPQIIGPVTVDGALSVEGKNADFEINTGKAMIVKMDQREILSGLKIRGSRRVAQSQFTLQFAALAGLASGAIWLRPLPGERLSGAYQLTGLETALPRAAGLRIKHARLSGSFITPPLEQFLQDPRLHFGGDAETDMEGEANGKIRSHYGASLHYQPASIRQLPGGTREFPPQIQLSFDPKADSRVSIGPLTGGDGKELVRGDARLKGLFIFIPQKNQFSVAGNRIGFESGRIFLQGQTAPTLTNLSLDAEQLWGISRGVASGRSLRFEADLDLNTLLDSEIRSKDPEDWRRHVRYIVDRQPLSLDALYRLIARDLQSVPVPEVKP